MRGVPVRAELAHSGMANKYSQFYIQVIFAVEARQAIIGEQRRVTTLHDRKRHKQESEASRDLVRAALAPPVDRIKTEHSSIGLCREKRFP
jgi:hypothetical protein